MKGQSNMFAILTNDVINELSGALDQINECVTYKLHTRPIVVDSVVSWRSVLNETLGETSGLQPMHCYLWCTNSSLWHVCRHKIDVRYNKCPMLDIWETLTAEYIAIMNLYSSVSRQEWLTASKWCSAINLS